MTQSRPAAPHQARDRRGHRRNHLYGTLTSPNTFGGYGAGTTIYWVDAELDLTYRGLSGYLRRHQKQNHHAEPR